MKYSSYIQISPVELKCKHMFLQLVCSNQVHTRILSLHLLWLLVSFSENIFFSSGPPLFKFVNLLEKLGLLLWNVLVFDCFPVVFELFPVSFTFLARCMTRDWFGFWGRTYLSGLQCTSLMFYWCQAWAVGSSVATWSFYCSLSNFLVRV